MPQSDNSVPLVTLSYSPDTGFCAVASEGSGNCF